MKICLDPVLSVIDSLEEDEIEYRSKLFVFGIVTSEG